MTEAPLSRPATAADVAAAHKVWAEYARAHPEAVAVSADYSVERFGDSESLADELLELVLTGRKRATAGLVAEFLATRDQLPRIGSHWIVCDGRGLPRIIIRSVELRLRAFNEVDAQFAFDEGEDDRSLESWRRNHRNYWQRITGAHGTAWSQADEIVLQRFQVVWPPEFADAESTP